MYLCIPFKETVSTKFVCMLEKVLILGVFIALCEIHQRKNKTHHQHFKSRSTEKKKTLRFIKQQKKNYNFL